MDEWGRHQPVRLHQAGRDWELVHELGWTWQELQSCPMSIRRLWTGFLMEGRSALAEQLEQHEERDAPTFVDQQEAQDTIAAARARVEALEAAGA